MKRVLPVFFLLVLLSGMGTAVLYAAPEWQGAQPDLVPLGLSWPDNVTPGDEIDFDLRFTNVGADIEGEVETTFSLSLETTGDAPEPVVEPFEKSVTISNMETGDTRIVTGTLSAPREGSYTVAAAIGPIEGEANEDNNTRSEEFEVTSALPPEIANLFAGLGMFAAVMAIVAVGTEVVVDSVRVLLGLKRKVTALEALDKLQDQLPGQLADLGVSAPKLEEFNGQVKELKETLKPVVGAADMAASIRDGKLGEMLAGWFVNELAGGLVSRVNEMLAKWPANRKALAGEISAVVHQEAVAAVLDDLLEADKTNFLEELLTHPDLMVRDKTLKEHLELKVNQEVEDFIGEAVTTFKATADRELDKLPAAISDQLDEWMADLALSDYYRRQLRSAVKNILSSQVGALKDKVSKLKPEDVYNWLMENKDVLQNIYEELARINKDEGPEAAADWLEQQGETFIGKGSREVMGKFDNELRPFLESLGLAAGDIDKTRSRLEKGLGYLSSQAQASTALYVDSVKALLISVEERRKEMQSPARKAWRNLRKSSYPLSVALISLAIAVAGIVIGVLLIREMQADIGWWVIFLPLAMSIIIAYFGGQNIEQLAGSRKALKFSIGDLATRLETFWNNLMQRPNSMGEVEEEITDIVKKIDEGISATKLAAVLQERADQHRDEEASRLRWLRVISLVIGVALAYLLKIDAAVLLDTVIPGISEKINILPLTSPPFSTEFPLTPGMILTGLAASAGSAFWHDQLDRLQASKRATEEAALLLRDVQGKN